jgi:serine/threonine protein kinase
MSTPEDDRDEQLASALEQSLGRPALTLSSPVPDPELTQLIPVADLLRRLNDYLRSDPEGGYIWAAPPAGGPSVPAQVGKYRVLRALGSGGQAETLLAVDPDLERQVVLKLYHERRPEVLEEVLREGQALARVRSPRVAQCYGVERHDGLPFLVMEYIPGRNLAEVLADGPLDVAAAVELGAQLAEGLAAVHACGLLHRDLKPANVLIGRDNLPRLVDFGLSVFHGRVAVGELAGTVQYMAPEQAGCEADRIDPRTDIWGLGGVLYTALTGKPPHEGKNAREVLEQARVGRVRPPRDLRPDLPETVNSVVLRCLAADPAGRYASAGEAAEGLRSSLRQKVRRSSVRWWLGAVAAALLVGCLAAGIDFLLHRPDRETAPKLSAGWHPDGRLLRRDFALNVTPHGGTSRPDGVVVFRAGEFLRLSIEASRDCSIAVFYASATGQTVCLLPNPEETDNRLGAGQPRLFPQPQPGNARVHSIRLKPSPGIEHLFVLASTKPWQPPETATRDGLFARFAGEDEKALGETVRGLEWVEGPGRSGERALVAEQVVPFVVEPARE